MPATALSALLEEPAASLAALVKAGDVSAVELTQASLARCSAVEPSIAALLRRRDDEALACAAAIDAKRQKGETLGVLAGVPMAIKDNLAIASTPVTCASRVLEGYRSPYDATVVARLQDAGAVIVGQANMDEFAMGSSCENSAFQVTRNPWDIDRVPGGSSGGSAAAVAAGEVPLALGSDTGGSVRQPAAFCGVVGLKPTYGSVSRYGLVAFASSLDQVGPLARSVEDAALAFSVIGGPDPCDSTCDRRPLRDPLRDLDKGVEGLRIGFLREIETQSLEPEVLANWQECLTRLSELGADVTEVSVPSLPAAIAVYYVIANSEASANLARYDGVRYGNRISEPTSLNDLYVRTRSEGLGPEVKRRILLGTFALSSGYYDAYYARAVGVARAMRAEFERAFSDVDLVVTPTSPSAAFPVGERTEDPLAMYLSDVFTTPANLCGLPALSVPSGVNADGLPLALQFLGPAFDDATVLRAGAAFETATGWNRRRPALETSSPGVV